MNDLRTMFQDPFVDTDSIGMIMWALIKAYRENDRMAVGKAAQRAQQYIDAGGDYYGDLPDELEDYQGTQPERLAEQYILRVLRDRHCDNDSDQEYIRTGWKDGIKAQPVQLSLNF